MGFPIGCTEVFLPKIFLLTLSFLGFIRALILTLFDHLGLSEFLETENTWPEPTRMPGHPSLSAAMIRKILPTIKFEDLSASGVCGDLPERCAVCLYEFEGGARIRRLNNCNHIFHRACLDGWMDHGRNTCPLCRTSFAPDEMEEEFNQRLRAAYDVGDHYREYSSVPGL